MITRITSKNNINIYFIYIYKNNMSAKELTRRTRFKWSVNEILSLQREYELYELSIQEIALLHKRSVFSILHKLEREQIVDNFADARGFDKINFWDDEYQEEQEQSTEESDDDVDEEYNQKNNEENVIDLSLQIPTTDDSDDSDDSDDDRHVPRRLDDEDDDNDNENVSQPPNIDSIDVVYFEDELMKKVETANNKKKYETMTLFDIVYELIERIESLEDKIVSIETANSNSFFAFVKNWFIEKRLC